MRQITIFTCATVLLINVWNAKRMGLAADVTKDIKDVQRADYILSKFEKRYVKLSPIVIRHTHCTVMPVAGLVLRVLGKLCLR